MCWCNLVTPQQREIRNIVVSPNLFCILKNKNVLRRRCILLFFILFSTLCALVPPKVAGSFVRQCRPLECLQELISQFGRGLPVGCYKVSEVKSCSQEVRVQHSKRLTCLKVGKCATSKKINYVGGTVCTKRKYQLDSIYFYFRHAMKESCPSIIIT